MSEVAEKNDVENESHSNCGQLDLIDHIAIQVSNVRESVDWYQRTFNCKVKYQDETWAFLSFANIKLALVVPGQHPGHMAFIRDDAEKYGELKTHRDGTQSCYVKDPAGNAVEIMKPY